MIKHLAALALLPALAWSCAKIPATHYYVLEPAHHAASLRAARGMLVGVRAFHVDPPYDQDRLVYRIGEQSPQVGFYAYHRWAAPLSRMLPGLVAAAFYETPGIAVIEPAEAGRDYAAYLDGRVLTLEEVDFPSGPAVRVRLTLWLVRSDGVEIWSEHLSAAEPGQRGEGVEQLVARMRRALEQTLAEARPRLAAALRKATD